MKRRERRGNYGKKKRFKAKRIKDKRFKAKRYMSPWLVCGLLMGAMGNDMVGIVAAIEGE